MATDHGPDPFAAMGGGRFVEGVGWVDKNNPAYQYGDTTPAAPANQTPAAVAPDQQGNQTPGTLAGTTAAGNQNSSTPGAAPTTNTTNQGTQDTVRNTYLAQATQNPIPTANDAVLQPQIEAYRNEVNRAKDQYLQQQAEAAGPYATGALRGQERMASEAAGQNIGQFAAQAVGNELTARRAEIADALKSLAGILTDDQTRALQQKLADLDAQLKTLGITTAAASTAAGQDITKSLGIGQLNLGFLNALLNNQQFGDQLGFNIADREAYYNNLAAQQLLNG